MNATRPLLLGFLLFLPWATAGCGLCCAPSGGGGGVLGASASPAGGGASSRSTTQSGSLGGSNASGAPRSKDAPAKKEKEEPLQDEAEPAKPVASTDETPR
jgi:hypothetical protein